MLSFTYADFSDPSGLTLIGDATISSDNALRVVPAELRTGGNAWVTEPQYVAIDFQTTFDFRLSDPANLAFFIQNETVNTESGEHYWNGNAISVEFDTSNTGWVEDPNGDHVSVHTGSPVGEPILHHDYSIGWADTTAYQLDDGNVHTATITYDSSAHVLAVFLDDTPDAILTVAVNIEDVLDLNVGRAWVGFAASTWDLPTDHDVLSWEYTTLEDTMTAIGIDDLEHVEGDNAAYSFTISRLGDVSGIVTVDWGTEDGSAAAGSDFAGAFGSVTFARDELQKTIPITVYDDGIAEPHEEFFVNLSISEGTATLVDGRARGTILNDDATLSVSDAVAVESDDMPFSNPLDTGRFIDVFAGTGASWGSGSDVIFGPDHTGDGVSDLYLTWNNVITRFDGATGDWIDHFVPVGYGGITGAQYLAISPHDGNLYVSNRGGNNVIHYDINTGEALGEFVTAESGYLRRPIGMVFGPDDDLYVTSQVTDTTSQVLKFDGQTGDYLGIFVAEGTGGLDDPGGITFSPNGDYFYISEWAQDNILKFNSDGTFVGNVFERRQWGISSPREIVFGPNGDMYFAEATNNRVIRCDGASGAYLESYASAPNGGLDAPYGLAFGDDGNLYVSSSEYYHVLRYGPESQAVFTVSLEEPTAQTVIVDLTTAPGTANADMDYSTTAASVTFAPGEITKTVVVPTIDDSVLETSESFYLNVIGATSGTNILDGQGEATITEPGEPIFYERFEDGQLNPVWVQDSQNDWFLSPDTLSAQANGRASEATLTLANAVNMTWYSDAVLQFYWNTQGFDGNDYIALDLFNGSSWVEVSQRSGTSMAPGWFGDEVALGADYLVEDFRFRFRANVSKWDEQVNVDNIRLVVTSLVGPPNQLPVANAGGTYSGTEDLTASFDASNSYDLDGSIVEYTWDFGDGTTPVTTSSATVNHTYVWGDTFDVTLTVEDDRGGTANDSTTATITEVNDVPVADPGGPYNGVIDVAVSFDGSGSSDFDNEDGTPINDQTLSYSWDFGDTRQGSGVAPSHTYTAVGTYIVTLSVSDGEATSPVMQTQVEVTEAQSTMHVGDLEGTATAVNKRKWMAHVTVLVQDAGGAIVPNATVQGTWSNGLVSTATTDSNGIATVNSGNVDNSVGSVTFIVTDITHGALTYEPGDNGDLDGDSDGTTITVIQGQALMAEGGVNVAPTENLSLGVAEAIAAQALTFWSQQVVTVPMVNVKVADLPAGTLGWASGDTITLDINADGAGWYTDFGVPVTGRVDLLTVVSHEIGHVLGYGHSDVAGDLMCETLTPGTRRLPGGESGVTSELHESVLTSPLLFADVQLDRAHRDLDDHQHVAKDVERNGEADSDTWMLPLITADYTTQPQRTSDTVRARIVKTIADEESELLDDELLDLIAVSQQ